MKSQSLLSEQSNLSQLSNISYRAEKKDYNGSEFFRQSLPPGHKKINSSQIQAKQQQIGLCSLQIGVYRKISPDKVGSSFTPFWTSEFQHHIQGISDNESQFQYQKNEQNQQHPHAKSQLLTVNADQKCLTKNKKQQEQEQEQGLKQNQVDTQKNAQISEDEDEMSNKQKFMKNETKNIPKNYGKAIIIFIQNNRDLVQNVLTTNGDNYDNLISRLRTLKKKINTISDLRNLWQNQIQSKSIRIISNNFLRKHSLHYIYNSRIKTRMCHAKYKRRLQQAILHPEDFNHIKDY